MLCVDQNRVIRPGGFNPRARIFYAAGILRNGNYLEIFAFQFAV